MIKDEVLKYFNYDKEKGQLIWKFHWNRSTLTKLLNTVVTSSNKRGYIYVGLKGKKYKVHRLIWLIENNNLPEEIDHIDGNVKNNKITNLRPSDRRNNMQNRKSHRNGSLPGSSFHIRSGKWRARYQINKKQYHIGLYDTEIEAHEAYINKLEEVKKLYIKE